jgi:anti-anti-sigma regulatory factor
MKPAGNAEFTADVNQNLLKLLFSGAVSRGVLEPASSRLADELQKLKPRFSLLTDFTDMESMSVDCAPVIEKVMDQLRDRGVELVVRIVPDPDKDIGMNILSLFHYPRSVKIVTTETRVEAQGILAQH